MRFLLTTDRAVDVSAQSLNANAVFYLGGAYVVNGEKVNEPETEDEHEKLNMLARENGGVYESEDWKASAERECEIFFDVLLERKNIDILHLARFGNSYQRAYKVMTKEAVKFPRREMYVAQTNTFSAGMQIYLQHAQRLRRAGASVTETQVALSELSAKVETLIVVPSTQKLRENGFIVAPDLNGTQMYTALTFNNAQPKQLYRQKSSMLTVERLYATIMSNHKSNTTIYITDGGGKIAGELYGKLTTANVSVNLSRAGLNTTFLLGVDSTVIAYEHI